MAVAAALEEAERQAAQMLEQEQLQKQLKLEREIEQQQQQLKQQQEQQQLKQQQEQQLKQQQQQQQQVRVRRAHTSPIHCVSGAAPQDGDKFVKTLNKPQTPHPKLHIPNPTPNTQHPTPQFLPCRSSAARWRRNS